MRNTAGAICLSLAFLSNAAQAGSPFTPAQNIDGTCSPIYHKGEGNFCLEKSAQDTNRLVRDLKSVMGQIGKRNGAHYIYTATLMLHSNLSSFAGWYDTSAWCNPEIITNNDLLIDLENNEYFLDYKLNYQLRCINKALMTLHILHDKIPDHKGVESLNQRAKNLFDGLIEIRTTMINKGMLTEDGFLSELASDRKKFLEDKTFGDRKKYIGNIFGLTP